MRMRATTQRDLERLYRAAKDIGHTLCNPIDRFLDLCLRTSAIIGPPHDVDPVIAGSSSNRHLWQSLTLRRWHLRPLVVLARLGRFGFVRQGNPFGEGEAVRREEVLAQLLRIIDAV